MHEARHPIYRNDYLGGQERGRVKESYEGGWPRRVDQGQNRPLARSSRR